MRSKGATISSEHVPVRGERIGARSPVPFEPPPAHEGEPAPAREGEQARSQPVPRRPVEPDRDWRTSPSPTRGRLRSKLSSRTALRDAVVLHEVLGSPVALRDPRNRPPDGR